MVKLVQSKINKSGVLFIKVLNLVKDLVDNLSDGFNSEDSKF